MMLTEQLNASWDETSTCILFQHGDFNKFQNQLLQLTNRIYTTLENNENTLNMQNPRY